MFFGAILSNSNIVVQLFARGFALFLAPYVLLVVTDLHSFLVKRLEASQIKVHFFLKPFLTPKTVQICLPL